MPRCKVQNYITVDGRVTVDIELPSIFSFVWKRVYYADAEGGTFKIYETDDLGRVKRVSGELELGKLGRNNYQQGKSVTLKDGTRGVDQGGHLVAHPFKGAGEQINYVPMKGSLNQGAWKQMEDTWAKALKEVPPKAVDVDIRPIYDGISKRPTKIKVVYKIDGKEYLKTFPNN